LKEIYQWEIIERKAYSCVHWKNFLPTEDLVRNNLSEELMVVFQLFF